MVDQSNIITGKQRASSVNRVGSELTNIINSNTNSELVPVVVLSLHGLQPYQIGVYFLLNTKYVKIGVRLK